MAVRRWVWSALQTPWLQLRNHTPHRPSGLSRPQGVERRCLQALLRLPTARERHHSPSWSWRVPSSLLRPLLIFVLDCSSAIRPFLVANKQWVGSMVFDVGALRNRRWLLSASYHQHCERLSGYRPPAPVFITWEGFFFEKPVSRSRCQSQGVTRNIDHGQISILGGWFCNANIHDIIFNLRQQPSAQPLDYGGRSMALATA
jgi:hypothetical protein